MESTSPKRGGPTFDGWVTIAEAAALSGYSPAYVRQLANRGRIDGHKVGRDWLIERESLEAYRQQMEALGPGKHDPWRADLASQGRGRQAGH
jgi:excisionase family DNA binding protein